MSEKPAIYKIGNVITGAFKKRPFMIDGEPLQPYGNESVSSDSQNPDNMLNGRLLLEVAQRTHGPNRKERAVAEARKIQAEGRIREYFQSIGILED